MVPAIATRSRAPAAMPATPPTFSTLRTRIVLIVVVALLGATLAASEAAAHTAFSSSTPADGQTAAAPVNTITLKFTHPARLAGEGIVVLGSSGDVVEPRSVKSDDGRTWVVQLNAPLAAGKVGVRWSVQAGDAHPIQGAFSFIAPAADGKSPSTAAGDGAKKLDEFLADGATAKAPGAQRIDAAGRVLTIGGTLLAIGALVFGLFVLRGTSTEVTHVVHWIRRAGAVVIIGGVVRLLARTVVDDGGAWSALWSPGAIAATLGSSTGLAIVLTIVGGATLLAGAAIALAHVDERPDRVGQLHQLVGVGAASRSAVLERPDDDRHALAPSRSRLLIVAVALLLVAYDFDGHTVTEGPRLLTGIVDILHLAGAAIWTGGVLMLVLIARGRARERKDPGTLHLAARFSVVAAVSVVIVGLSGLTLTVTILDSVSGLWATPWGRLLIGKVLLVGVAAGIGAYNHHVLIPEMERDDGRDGSNRRFRTATSVEAGVLAAVAALTALLVGAAS